jgi:hypothetical protein
MPSTAACQANLAVVDLVIVDLFVNSSNKSTIDNYQIEKLISGCGVEPHVKTWRLD